MTGRVGVNQLDLLAKLGSPLTVLLVGDDLSDSLLARGLVRQEKKRRGIVITPAGLRALADALEAGRIDDVLTRVRAERGVHRKPRGTSLCRRERDP